MNRALEPLDWIVGLCACALLGCNRWSEKGGGVGVEPQTVAQRV